MFKLQIALKGQRPIACGLARSRSTTGYSPAARHMLTSMVEISDALPGAELIREGFRDLEAGVESVPALLVLVGAPRLRRLGFDVADTPYFP